MFSRGLRSIGVESRAVMPGPERVGDDPSLIRTSYHNLTDSFWWKSLGIDGVILYSWAAPRYTPVAKAIRDAGLHLLVCMDTCGVISPQANRGAWFFDLPTRVLMEKPFAMGKMREVAKFLVESLMAPVAKARLHHYNVADAVSVPTPDGVTWVRNEIRSLGDPSLISKIHYLPHPQSPQFRYDDTPKEKLVVSMARWRKEDWAQKNPRVLLKTYRRFLSEHKDWNGIVVGSGATSLLRLLSINPIPRLEFREAIDPSNVPSFFNRASIGFWSSRWEGQQGTAAQALCCGCSVVSHSSPMMSCFRHYVSRDSGKLADRNTPADLASALSQEALAWERGNRNPENISRAWMGEFHADQAALRAMKLLNLP